MVTYLLTEAHSGYDLPFQSHRFLPWLFGGSVRHEEHHQVSPQISPSHAFSRLLTPPHASSRLLTPPVRVRHEEHHQGGNVCFHQFFKYIDDARGLGPRALPHDSAYGMWTAAQAEHAARVNGGLSAISVADAAPMAGDAARGTHGHAPPREGADRVDGVMAKNGADRAARDGRDGVMGGTPLVVATATTPTMAPAAAAPPSSAATLGETVLPASVGGLSSVTIAKALAAALPPAAAQAAAEAIVGKMTTASPSVAPVTQPSPPDAQTPESTGRGPISDDLPDLMVAAGLSPGSEQSAYLYSTSAGDVDVTHAARAISEIADLELASSDGAAARGGGGARGRQRGAERRRTLEEMITSKRRAGGGKRRAAELSELTAGL